MLLDFELRRTVEEPKNQKTFFPGFWFPGPGNRCRDVFGDSKSTREPVLKALSEFYVMALQRRKRLVMVWSNGRVVSIVSPSFLCQNVESSDNHCRMSRVTMRPREKRRPRRTTR